MFREIRIFKVLNFRLKILLWKKNENGNGREYIR